ncbi:MAG: bifunctional metallophosphatase/5'-nucleotidase [Ignavibacteriales bacterium]|nr:bifunctional metallophosphatase/5'-nucleotidase [Ignavibacteriales bacterium]
MIPYFRLPFLVIAGLLSLSSIFCQPKKLTIIHTNDIHASFLPHEAGWIRTDPKPMVGGFLELNRLVDSLRKAKSPILLLDAGDVMTGNPIAEMEYEGAFGGALFEMLNMIGYEAWTIGNHDLDISHENLRRLTEIAKFPTLSANLVDSTNKLILNNVEYLILNKGDLKVGIIGIMSDALFELTNTNNLKGLKVLPTIETTQKLIDKIDPETDLIIALTHQGVEDDSILATRVKNLDVIIGSHSHTRLRSPKTINGILICQTGAYCENLGELELTVENDKITASSGKLHTLWTKTEYPESELSNFVMEFKDKVDNEYSQVVGKTELDLKRSRSGESNIGHFIADAIREGSLADFAIMNSSGIRKDIVAGNIKKVDLFEMSPFRNYLCTVPITGKEIRDLAEKYIKSLISGRTSLDFSGIKCDWRNADGKIEIVSLSIGGKNVEEDNTYLCGTIDYIINQADRYLEMKPRDVKSSQILLFQALIDKVKRDKIVKGSTENLFNEVR